MLAELVMDFLQAIHAAEKGWIIFCTYLFRREEDVVVESLQELHENIAPLPSFQYMCFDKLNLNKININDPEFIS